MCIASHALCVCVCVASHALCVCVSVCVCVSQRGCSFTHICQDEDGPWCPMCHLNTHTHSTYIHTQAYCHGVLKGCFAWPPCLFGWLARRAHAARLAPDTAKSAVQNTLPIAQHTMIFCPFFSVSRALSLNSGSRSVHTQHRVIDTHSTACHIMRRRQPLTTCVCSRLEYTDMLCREQQAAIEANDKSVA